MAFCTNCGSAIDDNATFCTQCGAPVNGEAPVAQAPYFDPFDHTAEFDPQDVSDNKVYAMLVYLLGVAGAVVAMLGAKDSPYTQFHIRQGLKFFILGMICGICAAVLCWTIVVPLAAGIASIVLFVLKIIAFFQVCSGKAVEPSIIRDLTFLK